MKIAMVPPLAGAGAGGRNVHVTALAAAVAGLGHEVTVYLRGDDAPPAPGVTVARMPDDPAGDIPDISEFSSWLERRFRADRPDVVHSHAWMSGLAALDAAGPLGVPVVHTCHALATVQSRHQDISGDISGDIPGDIPGAPGRIDAEARIGGTAAAVVAACPDEVDELIRMGVPRHRVHVVPCGVDLEHFRPDGRPVYDPRRPRLLSLGRPAPRKGVDTVIGALPYLPGMELVVAGGPPLDGLHRDPEIARLRETAARAGVADRVTFVGEVARRDVPALMRAAAAVVTVPWYEPFGLVALEAMACGAPVIASCVGGQRETVVNNVTGLLVPPRQEVILARAVRKLLGDPVRRAAYGIAGADRARARYGWTRIAAETVSAYTGVLESEPSAGCARWKVV
ncbi:glycosyl transferase [Acrocarpospora phusangensis]|uniref:Glycosyl transferase n=1 Tax=Acrocarpospora phusangensis TaxID=1070424 RepID=A0A919UN59_9ACTN|nr:glycosyltransferase [Acrocarpospora phusangensis]GIH24003.1 glycosyl transferase [Acrocarpospora phusangensis]